MPGARLDDASALGAGWGSTAYRVPDADGDWTMKVPRRDTSREVTGDLRVEAGLLPLLAAAGLPTPRDARAILDGRGELLALAHRFVEGGRAEPQSIAGRARRARFASDVGRFLARLHAIDVEGARAVGVPELDLWPDRYAPMIEDCRPLLSPRTLAWLDETAAPFVAAGGTSTGPRTLVHGDISPAHLRVDEVGTLGRVIDFGDAMIADPAIDLAGVLWGYGWPLAEQVLAAYVETGATLDAEAPRRMRFYVDTVPLFLVRYGDAVDSTGDTRRAGVRQLAARAAAATRRSQQETALR